MVAVFGVIGRHMESHLGPISCHVADDLNRAVRDNVQRAIAITQRGSTHCDFFHSSGYACRADGVAYLKLVFNEDKKAVYYVFYQCLRTKTNGESGNACAGKQRFNIDIEGVFERGHASEEHD